MKSIISLLLLAVLSSAVESPIAQVPIRDEPAVAPLSLKALPLLGFGTWRLQENCSEAVSWAIQAGYRHIDCAAIYGNEELVGIGIRDGLRKSGLKRENLWITSKLWNNHHEPDQVEAAIDESISKLGVGYLDLYLMHWPVAQSSSGKNKMDYLDGWEAMGKLVEMGKARHVGVANFSPKQMEALLEHGTHPPQVHQMELHPYLQQNDWIAWHSKHGIHVTAYSPFAGTNPVYDPGTPEQLLNNSVITKIADKRECTAAQVAIMWGLARNTSVIPKSSHKERVIENFHSLECVLHGKDIKKIDKLGKAHYRFNNPSKSWGLPLFVGLEDWKGKHKKNK